ncbi:MAG: hypothetical protein F6K19_13795 [Cyanothece sp. SIO1E1]|nr:hypothetical protein [Cyanothece sp. SIO1E1]
MSHNQVLEQNQVLAQEIKRLTPKDFQYFNLDQWEQAIDLSDNLSKNIIRKANRTIIVIDNVLQNPYKFRDLLINGAKLVDCRWHPTNFSPGYRQFYDSKLFYSIHKLAVDTYAEAHPLARLAFKMNVDVTWKSSFTNIYQEYMKVPPRGNQPHCDGCNFVWSLWLNEESGAGGTSFWSYQNKHYYSELNESEQTEFNSRAEQLDDGDDLDRFINYEPTAGWQLELISEMKFNRLLIYPGNSFHAPHIPTGVFEDAVRYALISMGIAQTKSGY